MGWFERLHRQRRKSSAVVVHLHVRSRAKQREFGRYQRVPLWRQRFLLQSKVLRREYFHKWHQIKQGLLPLRAVRVLRYECK